MLKGKDNPRLLVHINTVPAEFIKEKDETHQSI